MKFVDEAVIEVHAGKGGDGCLSFHRGPNLPKGGPDGGNGGVGGDVVLIGDAALNTLVDFRFRPRHRAASGGAGGSRDKTGANGEPLTVRVPVGTTVIDEETRTTLGDVDTGGATLRVAVGGGRGYGNAHFKSSTDRAPRRTTPGRAGERRRLRLELRVVADVGLFGLPNAGKSTLIASVSAARPKVADYPFTTLVPSLGVVRVDDEASFVMADLPGLIPGAAQGAGLGHRFLKHLSRTWLLLHAVDAAPFDGGDPVAACRAIEQELFTYSDALRGREVWLLATKMDLPGADEGLARLRRAFPDRPCFGVSAATRRGLRELASAVMAAVAAHRRRLADDAEFREQEQLLQERLSRDVLHKSFASESQPADADDDEVEVVYRRG